MPADGAATTTTTDDDLEVALRLAGHALLPGRHAGLMAAFKDTLEQSAVLRRETLGAELEPANVFSLLGDLASGEQS